MGLLVGMVPVLCKRACVAEVIGLDAGVGEHDLEVLRWVGYLKALSCSQVAVLLFGGDLERAYYVLGALVKAGLLRQKPDPWDKRKRVVVLTARGARAVGLSEGLARLEDGEYVAAVGDNEFYVRAVVAGIPPGDILSRREALRATGRAPSRWCAVSWGVRHEGGLHFVYVKKEQLTRGQLCDSVRRCGQYASGHTLVLRTEKELRSSVRALLREAPVPPLKVITLDEVGVFAWGVRESFGCVAERLMWAYAPGGRLVGVEAGWLAAFAWSHPRRGQMLLADLRLGDLQVVNGLIGHDVRRRPVTVFVASEAQARRWARHLAGLEGLWFLVCEPHGWSGLYRLQSGQVILHRAADRKEAAL
ncbi:MAG: winged helix DNA-binding protein [Bacillota bacterium]